MDKVVHLASFDIRKYSVYKIDENIGISSGTQNSVASSDQWFHHPQRSDISIHFVKFQKTNNINISILWKGTILDKVNIDSIDNHIISFIAKYPAVGFKKLDKNGILIKRFQVSFKNQDTFADCYKCIKDEFNLPIEILAIQLDNSNMSQRDQGKGLPTISASSKNSLSLQKNNVTGQTRTPLPPTPNIPKLDNFPAKYPNVHTGVFQDRWKQPENIIDYVRGYSGSQSPQDLVRNGVLYNDQNSERNYQTSNLSNNLSSSEKLQSQAPFSTYYHQLQLSNSQDSTLTNYPTTHSFYQQQILREPFLQPRVSAHRQPISQVYVTAKSLELPDQSSMRSIPQNENSQSRDLSAKKIPTPLEEGISGSQITQQKSSNNFEINKSNSTKNMGNFSLSDLKDEKLKQIIIEKLKDKEFINFVIRLDELISQKSN